MKRVIIFMLGCVLCGYAQAQITFPYNGILPKNTSVYALIHATIQVNYATRIQDATMIIENGRVREVGVDLKLPSGMVVLDMNGRYICPSFIDLYSDYGLPKTQEISGKRGESNNDPKGAYGWNPAIRSNYRAAEFFNPSEDLATEFSKIGIGVQLVHRMDGIDRGTASLVTMGNNPNQALLKPDAGVMHSFNKGTSTLSYPSSLMGSIALLRQTYYDACWYETSNSERNLTLEAWNANKQLPWFFDAGDKWNILRADELGDEFNVQYVIKTNGNEYQRLADMKNTEAAFIVPINFPDPYDVSDELTSRMISIEEMKHWEMAPANCAFLSQAQIPFSITAFGIEDKSKFLVNLRKAVAHGLKPEEALKALTHTPAELIGVKDIGALKPGMWANFIVSNLPLLEYDDAVIQEHWIQGSQRVFDAIPEWDPRGKYELQWNSQNTTLQIEGSASTPKAKMMRVVRKDSISDTTWVPVQMNVLHRSVNLCWTSDDTLSSGLVRIQAMVQPGDSLWIGADWKAIKRESWKQQKPKMIAVASPSQDGLTYPFCAYGSATLPTEHPVLFKNATVWTCDKAGKLDSTDVLIRGGKIERIGKNIDAAKYADVEVIDATGKHITPGIIDEHSHIALASVNEGAQASSAEVKESTVIHPDDIDIYRQLSGGVTCAQLLHGSANPIGGQSAIIKLRWGLNGNQMVFKGAPGFIKFALGENVKQSNWMNDGNRFPQTRMGVEQIFYDHFIRAREYGAQKKAWNEMKRKDKPAFRIDLEMEALLEILEKKRFITCHSYVQSEINMLMHVADSMGFTLNTFTHILEGFKVADKMKTHGAGASTFSDWWAYKYEVKDAIPFNGALMWEQGITVAFNSDDGEMARRLNQEAAKAVKYGDVPEEEALKFVTINPAKLLHIDQMTGSLVEGKDADVVLWDHHPLSIYARAEKTFVDGVCYYDDQRDAAMREQMKSEHQRIAKKMIQAKADGGNTQKPRYRGNPHFHCDTLDETGSGIDFKNR